MRSRTHTRLRQDILLAVCTAGIASTLLPALTYAADAPEDSKTTLLEEVVVTAERRSQNIQEIPLAITAFTDKSRDLIGIQSIQDLAQFTPGFSYNTAQDKPSIRGISRQSNTFSIESPVANYFDGVYTSSVADASRRSIFVERTEVLRGPQGALSGRGAIAGAINTISKRPSKEFETVVGVLAANFDRYGAEGTISGPIFDQLRFRLNAAKYSQDEGYFENVALHNTAGTQPNNREFVDFMLAGDIGRSIEYFIKASWSEYAESRKRDGDFAPVQAGSNVCTPNPFGGLTPVAAYGYFGPGVNVVGACNRHTGAFDNQGVTLSGYKQNVVLVTGDLHKFALDHHPEAELNNGHNFTTDWVWHAPFMNVRYIGGHQGYVYAQTRDADNTDVISMRLPAVATGAPIRTVNPGGVNRYSEDRTWYSHELNLTSTHSGPVQWVFGLYNSRENYDQEPQNLIYAGYDELSSPRSQANNTLFVQPNVQAGRSQFSFLEGETESKAVFGQIDWKPVEQLQFTAGLRYNKDTKDIREEVRFVSNSFNGGANGANLGTGQLAPIALDVTASTQPGFALVNPTTFVVPNGYRLMDVSSLGTVAAGTVTAACPGGQFRTVAGVTGCSTFSALMTNGVVDLPTTDAITGNRVRLLQGEWHATTGSVGVNYKPNKDTLLYARVARGYRPGGFNSGFIFFRPDVDEEEVNSYEIGTKFTFFGTLQINTAAFVYDYTNVQLPLPTYERCTTPGDFSTCINLASYVNLPSSENRGLEVEAIWAPLSNLQLNLSYGYLDARIKNGKGNPGFVNSSDPAAVLPTAARLGIVQCATQSSTCVRDPVTNELGIVDSITGLPQYFQDLSGNRLANSPKHKVAVNAAYTFNFSESDLTFSSTFIWRTASNSNNFNSANDITPSYTQTNIRAIYAPKDGRYRLTAYCQNLFDKEVNEVGGTTRRAIGLPGTGASNQMYYRSFDLAPPRIYVVELQRRF